jgi:CBS domain-containing protein
MEISQLVKSRSSAEIITCNVDDKVGDVIGTLASRRIGALPVMDAGEVVGIFSERDVIYQLADAGSVCLENNVGAVMTSPPITVELSAKVDEALGLMTRRRIRHLPVTDKGKICSFVSIGDLVKSRMDEIETDAAAMRDYIAHG